MIYISLAACNISELLPDVLSYMSKNTKEEFDLFFCDNASLDNTYELFMTTIKQLDPNIRTLYTYRFEHRVDSITCINRSLSKAVGKNYDLIVKLDHDYGLPENWDTTLKECFNANSRLKLLCPSVDPSTPKGMQYYSAGHEPLLKSNVAGHEIYHYQGIAGYAHTFTQDTFDRLKEYKAMNHGAIFGSEDADWSIRCGSPDQKGYVMDLQGMHWSKKLLGKYEDQWKGEATFLKTTKKWEDWVKDNIPENERKALGLND